MSSPIAHFTAASATITSVLGLIFHVLPGFLAGLASLAAVIWYGVQLYESHTVQHWLAHRHRK